MILAGRSKNPERHITGDSPWEKNDKEDRAGREEGLQEVGRHRRATLEREDNDSRNVAAC
jgi:hypothetical protein